MPNPISNTMCFRTWNDLIISLPEKTVKWCCKTNETTQQRKDSTFDLNTLETQGLDFLLNHPILQKRKHELSTGIQSKDCSDCWESEKKSGVSTRTMFSRDNKWLLDQNLDITKDLVQYIEIVLTNKCNMACTYCWEGLSSRWQKETGLKFPDTEDAIFEKLLELLNEYWNTTLKYKKFVTFSILGGEPFFTNHMYKFIEEFMVNVNDSVTEGQQVHLFVTTNLNFPDYKLNQFIELVKKTPNIRYEMKVSGEALGRQSELIRWGLDFSKWDNNVESFFRLSKDIDNLLIGFAPAHSSLSLPYFKDFLVYLNDKINKFNYTKEITMEHNWIQSPKWLQLENLHPKHAKAVQEQIDYLSSMSGYFGPGGKDRYLQMLKILKTIVETEVDITSKQEAKEQFKKLEKRRNISFAEHFAHYHELIE
jgi:organic radical activating enzyme